MTTNGHIELLNERIVALTEEIRALNERVAELESENTELKKRIESSRGVQAEMLVAELTGGARTRYKDRHDVTTRHGRRLEVKYSHLNIPANVPHIKRWNWDRLFGDNDVKTYDFLVLIGEKDPRHEAQY